MSHYIRTIHTDFTSRASPPYAGSSAAAHAGLLLNLGGLMNTHNGGGRYPPGLGHAQPAPYTRRPRRALGTSTPRSTHSAPVRRAPPPPPPRTSVAYTFDPFSDDSDVGPPPPSPTTSAAPAVLYRTTPASLPPSRPHTLNANAPAFTLRTPQPPVQRPQNSFDPNARSRLVAGILLNRVHAVGKPMRRRSFDGPKEYVKSGLSSVVCGEA
ncbi:hypothetical protein DXG01_014698 [Tephrocybe rancida]|nr:hypothetical protein DXG01_014698 [Tephrocybe rancida]